MPRFGGLVASASPRDRRPFLARLDGVSGSVRHARWLDLEPSHFVKRMASDGGQLIATGATGEPPGRAFVLAMSFEGHTRWRRYYHALDNESTVSINPVVASQGGAVVAGRVEGELALVDRTIGRRRQTTFFLLELSPEGDEVWSFALPPKAGIVRALARDADGDLYLAGWFQLPFKFAGKTVAPQPSSECTGAYVAKLVRTGDRSARPPAPP